MISKDQGIEHEQNLTNLPISIILLRAKTNKIDDIRPLLPAILAALDAIKPRSLVNIG